MKWVWIIIGVLAILSGLVWTAQGLDLLGGSAMSGDRTWAIVGPIVAVVGMLLLLLGLRKPRRD